MTVDLHYPPDAPLRPKMAREAARMAVGRDHGVIVWTADSYGYALYPGSQEKRDRTFKWDYEEQQANG